MSPRRPDVSVVIPTYQSGRFVAEAIDSALGQDEAPHEVIVVDDGSTDDTPEVIAAYGSAVIGVRHPENRGVAAARNTGIETLTGDVVVMLDADDRMLPHRLRVSVDRLLAGGKGVGCVLGQQRIFDGRGEADLPEWALEVDGATRRYSTSQVTAWRRTYEQVGGYDEAFDLGDDSDWLLRVRAAGLEVLLLDDVLTERRIHDTNISEQFADRSRDEYLRSVRSLIRHRRAGP